MRFLAVCLVAVLCLWAAGSPAGAVTVEYQVAASVDDTLTYSASSAYNVDNMFFPYDGAYPNNRPGFFRWAINVPAGATITSAYLKVNSYVTLTTASVVRLQLVDSDNCPALNSPNPYYYSVTSGYVDWTLPGEWTAGTWYTSPDIKDIVQEFIDRANYTTGNYLGLREDRYSGGYRRVRQWDYGDHTYGAKLEITYTTNEAPVADAGTDQEVNDSDNSGYELVTLDGTGSSDSDGTIASYVWSEGGSPIATGSTAQVSLAVGTHTITLTVTDDDSDTDEDTVQITVNQPPVANAGTDQEVNDSDNSGYELVTLDGTGSSDSDGTIVSYVWSEGGSPIATGSTAQVSLSVGTHTITLTVTDDDSATDDDTVQITVNQPPVANAGTDQQVSDSDSSGYELVTLDGTGSSDSDGTIASYVWSEEGVGQIATGSTAQVSLAVGTHTITLTVTDNDSATDADDVEITVSSSVTVEYQVAASADDTLTYSASSAYNVDNMFFPYDGVYPNNRPGFFRWAINVPAGATITSAYLKVNSYVTLTTASVVRLQLVDLDSCPALNSPNPYYYSVTSGYVDWTLPGEWTEGTWYTSPDIKTIVQEFIDRGNYTTGNYLGLREDRYSGGYRRVRQWDYGDHTYGAKLEITYTTGGAGNQAPVADAGSNQNVTDTDSSGYELVTLDGTGSSDSDGTITSYVWSEGGSPIATGETAQVSLAVGTHTITLTVTDDESATDDDTVEVVVSAPNQAPVANAGNDQGVTDTDQNNYELVTLDGTGSSDSDGTITSYVWTEGGSPIATGSTAQVSLAVGTHTITLTVTDDDSATDDDTVQITVYAGGVTLTAEAGDNQEVEDLNDSGDQYVVLDGSGSEGSITSYVWTESGVGQIATGETARVLLAVGTHTITLTVTDSMAATDDDTVQVVVTEAQPIEVEYQVAASRDDTLAYSGSSAFSGASIYFPYTSTARVGFYRWALGIPEEATIATAYFKANAYVTETPASTVRFQMVDSDSCPLLDSLDTFNLPVTSGYVDWALPTGDWTASTWYTSPDVGSIVQEFIDRAGYVPGNYFGLRSGWGSGGYRRICQWDYSDHTYGAKLVVTYYGGIYPPTAEAGEDQVLEDEDYTGGETVTLDGSASSDDELIVSYVWSEGASQIATGETAEVSLSIGTHEITLTITDDDGATDSDTVTVTVYADEYYADATNGSDSNPGTSSLPWQTFARIQAGPLYPGTTVYCTGDLGTVNIDSEDPCGTSQAPITYARWSGHDMPHIDSLTFDTSPVKDAYLVFQEFNFDPGYMASCVNPPPAVCMAGANYVTFDSCEFEGAKLAGDPPGDFAPYGIKESQLSHTFTSGETGGASYISIINCTFDHAAYALSIKENLAVPDRESDHWEVLGCEFKSGAEDAILATGNADLVVAGCYIHDQNYLTSAFSWPGTAYGTWPADYTWGTCTQDNTGASAIFYHMETGRIYLLPDDEDYAPRRSLYDTWRLDSDPTNVYFVPSAEGDCPHTDCIAVQGTVDGMLIENNRFECMEHSGQQIKLDPLSVTGNPKNVTIRNNLFLTTTDDPAYLLCVGGGGNVLVVHNTIDAGTVHPAHGIRYMTTAPPIDVVVRNNIISGAVWESGYPDSDYNCWLTTPPAGLSEGANSMVVTRTQAGFVDWENGDYHLTSGSYAIDEGDPNYAPAVSQEHPEGIDYDSNDRDESPDMGAYEYIE